MKFSFCFRLFCSEFWKLFVKRKKNWTTKYTYSIDDGTEQKRINKETRTVVLTKSSSHVRDGSGQQNPDPPLAKNGRVKRGSLILYVGSSKLSSSDKQCTHFNPPLSKSVPFYWYFKLLKATRKSKKSKQGLDVTPQNQTRNPSHRRPLDFQKSPSTDLTSRDFVACGLKSSLCSLVDLWQV